LHIIYLVTNSPNNIAYNSRYMYIYIYMVYGFNFYNREQISKSI